MVSDGLSKDNPFFWRDAYVIGFLKIAGLKGMKWGLIKAVSSAILRCFRWENQCNSCSEPEQGMASRGASQVSGPNNAWDGDGGGILFTWPWPGLRHAWARLVVGSLG